MPEAELQKLPGFGTDMDKNRAEAKKLLAEAGYPNGFKVVLKNRNVKLPYQDFAVFAVQEWRKIGIQAEQRPEETAAWFLERFRDDMQALMRARAERRKVALRFEMLVKMRDRKVVLKTADVQAELDALKKGGGELIAGRVRS